MQRRLCLAHNLIRQQLYRVVVFYLQRALVDVEQRIRLNLRGKIVHRLCGRYRVDCRRGTFIKRHTADGQFRRLDANLHLAYTLVGKGDDRSEEIGIQRSCVDGHVVNLIEILQFDFKVVAVAPVPLLIGECKPDWILPLRRYDAVNVPSIGHAAVSFFCVVAFQ